MTMAIDSRFEVARPEGQLFGMAMSRNQELILGLGALLMVAGLVMNGLDGQRGRIWTQVSDGLTYGGIGVVAGPILYQGGTHLYWNARNRANWAGIAPRYLHVADGPDRPELLTQGQGCCTGVTRQLMQLAGEYPTDSGAQLLARLDHRQIMALQEVEKRRVRAGDNGSGLRATGNQYEQIETAVGREGRFLVQCWSGELCHTLFVRVEAGGYSFYDINQGYYEYATREALLGAFKSWMGVHYPAVWSGRAGWYVERAAA
jgi:hypothetical protein